MSDARSSERLVKGSLSPFEGVAEWLPPLRGEGALPARTRYLPLVYHGGPLLVGPELVSLYVGPFDQLTIDRMQAWLSGFARYLGGNDQPAGQEPVVQQYGTYGATVGDFHVSPDITGDLVGLLVHLQQTGVLPPYHPERLFLIFYTGFSLPGQAGVWCGIHLAAGPGKYYALCPWPLFEDCSAGGTPESGWQATTSHEILEACTDPNGGLGWSRQGALTAEGEGGDNCIYNFADLPFGKVQMFSDNHQSACSLWTPRETAQLAATSARPGRYDVVFRGPDHALWHKGYDSAIGTVPPFGSLSLGGGFAGCPAIVATSATDLHVFARTYADGMVGHRWFDGQQWNDWEDLDVSIIGSPSAVARAGGWDVVALGTDGTVKHLTWHPGTGFDVRSISAHIFSPPTVISRGPDSLDVLAQGASGSLMHAESTDGGLHWRVHETAALGVRVACTPSVVSWDADRLDIFVRGFDDSLWHAYFYPRTIGWGRWENLGGPIIGAPCAVGRTQYQMDLFAHDFDDNLVHRSWNVPLGFGPGSWSPWERFGGAFRVVATPVAVAWSADRMDVFIEEDGNYLAHVWWAPGAMTAQQFPPEWQGPDIEGAIA